MNDRIKILSLFSKLKNSSAEFFDTCLAFFINNQDKLYDITKKPILDDKITFSEEFKSRCLMLDEYVFDTCEHDNFAISTKYLDYHFLTQDFRNKLVSYERKDKVIFQMSLDIKVI